MRFRLTHLHHVSKSQLHENHNINTDCDASYDFLKTYPSNLCNT